MSLEYNITAKYFVLLWKVCVYSFWSRDHDKSKKSGTIDIQAIFSSRDYDFKEGFFFCRCEH